jgi:hypothetical protein
LVVIRVLLVFENEGRGKEINLNVFVLARTFGFRFCGRCRFGANAANGRSWNPGSQASTDDAETGGELFYS